MNVTFLIGNGFDIGVGLKSSFRVFFPLYQASAKNKPDRIRQLANEIEHDYDTWADFEKALGQYTLKFTPSKKQDLIDQIRDFESEFVAYLKNQENNILANAQFSNRRYELCNIMNTGILTYYSRSNLANESNANLLNLHNKYKNETIIYNFVNFNYTHVLTELLNILSDHEKEKDKANDGNNKKRLFEIGPVVHVHGDYNTHPIIGLNDASQIANKELANDTRLLRYLLKPQMNQSLRSGNDPKATEIINRSTVICIYGMSMGVTDKKWWSLLVHWLRSSQERQLIIFDYDTKYNTDTPYGWLEKEDYYIDKLNDCNSDRAFDVNTLRSRIHIAVNKNIFSMTHITTAPPYAMTVDEYLQEKQRNDNQNLQNIQFATDEDIDALFNNLLSSQETNEIR